MKNYLRLVVRTMASITLASVVALPVHAQTQEAAMTVTKAPASQEKLSSTTSPDSASKASTKASIAEVVDPNDQTTKERLAHLTKALRHKWEEAVATLPSFCQHWEDLLQQREENNLSHLQWHEQQGYETATYVGYGRVLGCKAKESAEGVPIGKVIYEEKDYYLAGKTPQEAKEHPKVTRTTSTLEIFSWDKDRWFY